MSPKKTALLLVFALNACSWFTDFKRQPNVTVEPVSSFIVYGVKNLPITFKRA